jgi:SAM-dependent methyltransferase
MLTKMSRQRDSGWDESAAAWLRFADIDPNRLGVLDAPMLALSGDVRGSSVIDIGCGEGRFARMLASRGARIVGVDPTRRLVHAARDRHREGRYVVAGAEALPFRTGSFDLAVLYLVLIDIPDHSAAISEASRVLAPNGRLLIANLNPFVTAVPYGWATDADGRRTHYRIDRYMEIRPDPVEWDDIAVVNWHRPMEAYLQALLRTGLRLTHFEEPRPAPAALERWPDLASGTRVPYFHVMEWRKG